LIDNPQSSDGDRLRCLAPFIFSSERERTNKCQAIFRMQVPSTRTLRRSLREQTRVIAAFAFFSRAALLTEIVSKALQHQGKIADLSLA
jgi:hypothetical protein